MTEDSVNTMDRYFENMEDRHLMEQTQGALNELAGILREKILVENRIDILEEEVLGYDLEPHHRKILESQQATQPGQKQLTLAFRGAGKSTVGTVGRIVFEIIKNPNIRILLASNTQLQAEIFLREVKEHFEGNEVLIQTFGDFVGKKWDAKEIVVPQRTRNMKESTVTCIGVGGPTASRHYDCLDPETLVLASNGWREIREMRPGIRVMGHDGKFHSVRAVQRKLSNKQMIGLRAAGFPDRNWMTSDHRVLIKRNGFTSWTEAKDVRVGDLVGTPVPSGNTRQLSKVNSRINKLALDSDIWRLIGYWLAEGCRTEHKTSGRDTVRLCFGAHEEKTYVADCVQILKKVGITATLSATKNSTIIVRFSDPDIKKLLAKFGEGASDKFLPPFALNAPLGRQRELLRGYWRGDGHKSDVSSRYLTVGMVSISKNLLSGFQILLARFGLVSHVRILREAGVTTFRVGGREYESNTQTTYGLSCHDRRVLGLLEEEYFTECSTGFQPSRGFVDPYFKWSPIKSIEYREGGQEVWDIEVADCHSFLIPGMIVHNCVIGDDLVDEENSRTELQREKLLTWYMKSLLPTLEPDARFFHNGTCWNPNDLYSYLRKNSPDLQVCVIPAIGADGRATWEDKFPLDFLVAKRQEMGLPVFETQFQMNCSAMEGKIFNYDSFHWYTELPENIVKFQGVDLAIGQKDENDYFAHATIGLDPQTNKKYVIKVSQSRLKFNQQKDRIVKEFFAEEPLRVGIESNAYQAAQTYEVQEIIGKKRAIPIYTLKDKVTRAMKLAAACENEEILFHKKHMHAVEQLIALPHGDHDDMFDAIDLAVTCCKQGLRKRRSNEPGVI